MTFISLNYLLLFLPIVVALYFIFRTNIIANIVILAASYIFYGSSGLWFLIPLIFTSLLDFGVALALSQTDRQRYRKLLLIVSLSANLGLLGFFKYTPWLIASVNSSFAFLGAPIVLPTLAVVLPPGISFYTFQTMSYTIEVYRREMKASRRLIDYMAFVTFWPHLVAGPIMRARNLLHQLEVIRPVITVEEARYALMLIVWGIFKKAALADNFGNITNMVDNLASNHVLPPGGGLIFAYAFAGQIYCDFSAYTDIARGSAKLINVDLVRNFHTPYFSASPGEFWRRWHISLSTWLRDYLYIPLGGNRFGRWLEYRNLMITMILGGLWHGAGILFVAWGIWHGFLLVLYRMAPIDRWLTKALGPVGKWLSVILTFHLVCFGWILFRANLDSIGPILRSIPALLDSDAPSFFTTYQIVAGGLAVLGVTTLATDYLGYRKNLEFEDLFRTLRPSVWVALMAISYFGIVLLGKRESTQFIYFQF
jgi:D-alanyl-lipoteichoic acid acyltransferase DltB (MBOAT superfamily)